MKENIDDGLLKAARKVTAKRPRTVIDHIIEYGHITTEELKDVYGYNHPPRAARDVREQGIPLETFTVRDKSGRPISAYKFGNPKDIERHKLGGRKVFSKAFKKALIEIYNSKCAISGERYEERYLQVDHRIPYEIAGEAVGKETQPALFMLLSGAAQRQKSWSCENCGNFKNQKSIQICKACYWANPEDYSHVATKEERRLDLTFSGAEIDQYNKLLSIAKDEEEDVHTTAKRIISEFKTD